MLILFDFENIQNAHYQTVKRLIIEKFGFKEWLKSIKIGAVAVDNINTCLPDWNSSMKIYQVKKEDQAADNKLIELATRSKGNRCIIVSNDIALCKKIHHARREARDSRKHKSNRAKEKTITIQLGHENGNFFIKNMKKDYTN